MSAVKELATEVGRALSFRVGIATGLVIVKFAASVSEPREGGIVGDALAVAGRLLGLADTGTVVVDGATRKIDRQLFSCRDLGPVEPVGAAVPTQAWQVLGPALSTSLRGAARRKPHTAGRPR